MIALLVMAISLKFIMVNYWHVFHIWYIPACADTEGQGQGSGPPTENHKTIGFLSSTEQDTMLPSQQSMSG